MSSTSTSCGKRKRGNSPKGTRKGVECKDKRQKSSGPTVGRNKTAIISTPRHVYIQNDQPYDVFEQWLEDNLPSKHHRSNGVSWISVQRQTDEEPDIGAGFADIFLLKSKFKELTNINKRVVTELAEECGVTVGKWLFYGNTGEGIDNLWRITANGVVRGTIPSCEAKVSPVSTENNSHVICIYTKNFLDEEDVFAVRDGIRNAGIECPIMYKPDVYTHVGIYRGNRWGISPTLYNY